MLCMCECLKDRACVLILFPVYFVRQMFSLNQKNLLFFWLTRLIFRWENKRWFTVWCLNQHSLDRCFNLNRPGNLNYTTSLLQLFHREPCLQQTWIKRGDRRSLWFYLVLYFQSKDPHILFVLKGTGYFTSSSPFGKTTTVL